MKIVVAHRETGTRGLLVGAGYGAYRSERGSAFLGELNPVARQAKFKTICLANADGDFIWVNSDDYQIVEIDGKSTGDFFKSHVN